MMNIAVSLLFLALPYALAAEIPPLIATWTGHSNSVNSVVFSPDGTKALSGSVDTTIKLWHVATGRNLATWKGHSSYVMSVVFSADGTKALSGSVDIGSREPRRTVSNLQVAAEN
ncbi:MAG: hypothetical protein HZB91_04350 [Elusimicrobia bacterium]|nr:hypothetical protein [Elusimicrobiota bacterium]